MSWASENKFLTGFGAVMFVGVGTLGYLTYAAMDKYDEATGNFESAASQLRRLQDTKPALTDRNLKELLAQKDELGGKIADLQKELKSRVLPLPAEPVKPAQFQDKLKDTVAQVAAKAAAARVELPKNFYLGFDRYQSAPPTEAAAPLLARELQAIGLVMNALIKTGSVDLEKFDREPLPEEGQAGAARKRGGADRSDHGPIERSRLSIKFTSSDESLRKILTDLANDKTQLFVIRNMSVQNKQMESPPRLGAAPPPPPVPAAPAAPDQPPPPETPAIPAVPAPSPAPAVPAPTAHEGPLTYVFGTEKIMTALELEILNIEEPKPKSEKPEKGSKKKDK